MTTELRCDLHCLSWGRKAYERKQMFPYKTQFLKSSILISTLKFSKVLNTGLRLFLFCCKLQLLELEKLSNSFIKTCKINCITVQVTG